MSGEKSTNFNELFGEMPGTNEPEKWQKMAEEAKEFQGEHMQTGELANPTFGDNLATGSLRRYMNRIARMGRLQELEAPEVIVRREKEMAEKARDEMAQIDHEEVAEWRETFSKIPRNMRHLQNQIFTNLMLGDEKSQFVLQSMHPKVVSLKGMNDEKMFMLKALGVKRMEEMRWYGFIERMIEVDNEGKPAISDETLVNFLEWYQASLAKRQKELNREAPRSVEDYSSEMQSAVRNGRLPEEILKNLSAFEADSPRARNLNFSLFDMLGGRDGTSGLYLEHVSSDPTAPIGIRADMAVGNEKYRVIWHELTHVISGDMIRFGKNEEAERIVDEALTEHISNVVLNSDEWMGADDEEFEFMSGKTYPAEREVVKWLAFGGAEVVPPEAFYRAYAEYDPEYAAAHKEWEENGEGYGEEEPELPVGVYKQVLYDRLLKAWPECGSMEALGEMIVKKFGEVKGID